MKRNIDYSEKRSLSSCKGEHLNKWKLYGHIFAHCTHPMIHMPQYCFQWALIFYPVKKIKIPNFITEVGRNLQRERMPGIPWLSCLHYGSAGSKMEGKKTIKHLWVGKYGNWHWRPSQWGDGEVLVNSGCCPVQWVAGFTELCEMTVPRREPHCPGESSWFEWQEWQEQHTPACHEQPVSGEQWALL